MTGTRIKADPKARKQALIAVLIIGLLGLLASKYVDGLTTELVSWIMDDPQQTFFRLMTAAAITAVALAAPLFGLAIYFLRIAHRTLTSSRYPPPELRMVRDTILQEGDQAKRYAIALKAVALILTACGALLAAFILYAAYQIA